MIKTTYSTSGVNYHQLDPVKILAQKAGLNTSSHLKVKGLKEHKESRGESAYVIEGKDHYLAFVQEGLGTKNLVADSMGEVTGKTHYDTIAQDTVAMIVNDLITVGAQPAVVQAYWAVGNSNWFANNKRTKDLVRGWKSACEDAGATWGGGETPTLKDVVYEDAIDLAGSACGVISPKSQLVMGNTLKAGDTIVFFESSGIHANGITLARKIAKQLPNAYRTKLPSGKTYGDTLLTPTIIYAKLVNELQNHGIDFHYMVNITGHGWRKLMRARQNFTYMINTIPPVQEIFQFIQKHTRLSDKEMFETFNMGAGFAIFVAPKDKDSVMKIAQKQKIKAYKAGTVMKGQKQVVIRPLNIIYTSADLQIRQ